MVVRVTGTALAVRPGLLVRPGEPGDARYVLSSWLKSYAHGCRRARSGPQLYRERHRAAVLRLLERCAVTVAAWEEDPATILGWACTEASPSEAVVHYVYVGRDFRGSGIAHLLLSPLLGSGKRVIVTHVTDDVDLPSAWEYKPWRSYR